MGSDQQGTGPEDNSDPHETDPVDEGGTETETETGTGGE